MNRAILLGAFAMLVGCGDDKHPGYVAPDSNGGARAAGGKYNKAGSAGMAGRAGSSATSTRGGSAGSAGDIDTDIGGSAGTAGYAGAAGYAGTAGTPADGGSAGSVGTAGSPNLILAPVVKIRSPIAITDPNSDNVLKASTGNDSVNVDCTVTAANEVSPVDTSNVSIELEQNGKTTVGRVSGTQPDFHASFLATDIETGSITLRCSAPTTKDARAIGSDQVQTFVDRGPVVTINDPKDKSSHASNKALHIDARIETFTVDPLDVRAGLASVDVTVDERTMLKPPLVLPPLVPQDPLTGIILVDKKLNDTAIFSNTPPYGNVALKVIATNKRGTVVTKSIFIFVDQAPPTIKITSPIGGAVVKETGKVSFTIADTDSRIDLTQLRIRIGSSPDPLQSPVSSYRKEDTNWFCAATVPASERSYDCTFRYTKNDIRNYISQAVLFVDGADVAGNDTSSSTNTGTGNIFLNIDRVPPFIHLDPPSVRLHRPFGSTAYACSNAFDPVGAAAVGDFSPIGLTPFFRAFVWDTAQAPTQADLVTPAHTDPSSVYVYVQRDVSVPLLVHRFVDRNGDGADDDKYCNAINSDPETPAATSANPNPVKPPRPDAIQLLPVTPWGSPLETGTDATGEPSITDWGCITGISSAVPLSQCVSPADLPYVLSHVAGETIPVIYAKTPTNSEFNGCTGTAYQLPIDTTHGWMCAAAVANDLAGGNDGTTGNMGVSPPIHLCYQANPSGPISCPTTPAPPTCTDSCTIYDPFKDKPPINYVSVMPRIIAEASN